MAERQNDNFFSERDYIAPHNSIVEDSIDKIVRYDKHPYHESHSAPASIYISDSLLIVEHNTKNNADIDSSESQIDLIDSHMSDFCDIKSNSGLSKNNKLQERLYQYAIDSDALKHNQEKGQSEKTDKLVCFDTFIPANTYCKETSEYLKQKTQCNCGESKLINHIKVVNTLPSNNLICNNRECKDFDFSCPSQIQNTFRIDSQVKSNIFVPAIIPSNMSILNIINYLYNRLDWPCKGNVSLFFLLTFFF